MIPPDPIRIRFVSAPIRASIISGAVHASVSIAWCSDIQNRIYRSSSTRRANPIEFCKASAGVIPAATGDWSSTDSRNPFFSSLISIRWPTPAQRTNHQISPASRLCHCSFTHDSLPLLLFLPLPVLFHPIHRKSSFRPEQLALLRAAERRNPLLHPHRLPVQNSPLLCLLFPKPSALSPVFLSSPQTANPRANQGQSRGVVVSFICYNRFRE